MALSVSMCGACRPSRLKMAIGSPTRTSARAGCLSSAVLRARICVSLPPSSRTPSPTCPPCNTRLAVIFPQTSTGHAAPPTVPELS